MKKTAFIPCSALLAAVLWVGWLTLQPSGGNSEAAAEGKPPVEAESAAHWEATVELQSSLLTESSGVCCDQERTVWTHNDSGGKPNIFGFNSNGVLLGTVLLRDADARDWEDMCCFTTSAGEFIAIGDVGDNLASRKSVQIYVIRRPEKQLPESVSPVVLQLDVRYETGPVNCEALAFDNRRGSFWLASKENLRCRLFEVSVPNLNEALRASSAKKPIQVVAEVRGQIPLPVVTGADISPDGSLFVFCTYAPGGILARKSNSSGASGQPGGAAKGSEAQDDEAKNGGAVAENATRNGDSESRPIDWDWNSFKAFPLPPRKQGEAICFSLDNKKLLLTSEFAPTPLLTVDVPK